MTELIAVSVHEHADFLIGKEIPNVNWEVLAKNY